VRQYATFPDRSCALTISPGIHPGIRIDKGFWKKLQSGKREYLPTESVLLSGVAVGIFIFFPVASSPLKEARNLHANGSS
jgi:hypothetical protein